ncbi:MAG: two-component sensor histidine kinase [Firmicutes bacterium HGW-Firmicutes-15]|nr:MAG: two-component sensor histidine kinase [Firmicutes bacterium HGW-Firmicutes-15]
MKISIRTRLFITVNVLIVFFVLFSWGMNSFYLEKYYIDQNKQQLLTTTEMIDGIYNGNPMDLALEMLQLESIKGLNVLILNKNFEIKYRSRDVRIDSQNSGPSRPDTARIEMKRPEPSILLVTGSLSLLQSGEKVFAVNQDPTLNTKLLNIISMLHNGDYILLSTPLVSLHESAAIANRFSLFTGLLTIIIGSIVVFIYSKRFTRPILELNAIAQKMSQLDFSEKYASNNRDELGELGESINSLSDQLDKSISELKQANEKLVEDIEHERRIDEMRKEFISSVSHELKTPIALIQGYAEGLKVNIVEDEASKNFYCEVITDEANKMNKMVRELLDLSQVESGYFSLEKQKFNLSLLLEQILSKYEPLLKEKEILLSGERAENIQVCGDPLRIEQVLMNYLNNAINHIDDSKELRVSVEVLNKMVRTSVFNSGRPIPDESLDKIFTSFYKVDKARTRAYGGIGLGLSIVRAIMDLHQTNYGVTNRTDGVEFWFELNREYTCPKINI